ncbi:MAG: TonB-dependent receptor [Saprospiraceae bacterium]|nr:TonB-dependent receptor [Saprospiraceae bacterium]
MVGQTTIQGTVRDAQGAPVAFANVYLDEIYDGGASDETGAFAFTTTHQGDAMFVASSLGFETFYQQITVGSDAITIEVVLQSGATELNEVVIAAGAFEASDEKKATFLKPLDVVQNPVAAGDIYGALQTLPGVTRVGDETGIFVRGGEATETKTIIDGTIVDRPFFSDVPDIPSRGRFDPFLFKGTMFSTGGYSAEYGQAMSSVLVLNTTDLPQAASTGFGLNLVGVSLFRTALYRDSSAFLANIGYTNLEPYFALIPQRREWDEAPHGYGGALGYRKRTGSGGMLKGYAQFQTGQGAIQLENVEDPTEPLPFGFDNTNLYFNASYRGLVADNWGLFAGISASRDVEDAAIGGAEIEDDATRLQAKVTLSREIAKDVFLRFGSDIAWRDEYGRFEEFEGSWDGIFLSGYAETDIKFSQNLAIRLGLRAEHEGLIDRQNIAPRTSIAYKTGKRSQMAVAYGLFYQTPEADFQRSAPDLDFQRAAHYILNYQYLTEQYTFRIEAYHKDYRDLVTYEGDLTRGNNGHGHATGIDVFWRDKKTLKNIDYWISYSWIDSERKYLAYPVSATPRFITDHTLNVVTKYSPNARWQFGVGYTFASGRAYEDPNTSAFLDGRTKAYHNASLNASWLTNLFNKFTVIYTAINNPFNTEQIFDYRYSMDGSNRIAIEPSAGRSAFIGLFMLFL